MVMTNVCLLPTFPLEVHVLMLNELINTMISCLKVLFCYVPVRIFLWIHLASIPKCVYTAHALRVISGRKKPGCLLTSNRKETLDVGAGVSRRVGSSAEGRGM